MKDVIVSFATKGYHPQLLRLIDSCKQHWSGDLLIYSPDIDLNEYKGVTIHKKWPDPEGIQSFHHKDIPYQFKTALIQKAIELGYERIIWLDSSMQLKKDLTPLFDTPTGVTVFENLGHPTWKYLSDDAAKLLSQEGLLNNEEYYKDVYNIPQIWGGAFALNFDMPMAHVFFRDLKKFSINGSFKNGGSIREGFVAHRHDQAVMSVLVRGFCEMLPYGQILCPPHDTTGEYGTDPYLVCRGI